MTAPMVFDLVVEDPTVDVQVTPIPEVDVVVEETVVAAVLVAGPPGPPGAGQPVTDLLPQIMQDGRNTQFPLTNRAVSIESIQVFRNGLAEMPGIGFTATRQVITFTTAPLDTDVIAVSYQK
jgi:hypothetical protein